MTSTVQKKNRVNTLWRRLKAAVLIPFFMGVILMPAAASAKVDWEVSGAIQLEATPLAVVRTQEGDLTFVLTDKAQVVVEINTAGSPFLGPAGAEVAVVVFSDFQ
jgi:hypothetical protein